MEEAPLFLQTPDWVLCLKNERAGNFKERIRKRFLYFRTTTIQAYEKIDIYDGLLFLQAHYSKNFSHYHFHLLTESDFTFRMSSMYRHYHTFVE